MKKGIAVTRKIAITALLTALGLIVFIIENQFPPMFIPGARMGLANVFSFAALIMFSPAEAFLTVCLRTALGAIFAGNVSALMYSFTGGIVSMAVSSVLMYAVFPRVSVIAVSICSAVAHNITQNTVFVVLTGTANMFVYLPYHCFGRDGRRNYHSHFQKSPPLPFRKGDGNKDACGQERVRLYQ